MTKHPLHVLEQAARGYERARRASVQADNTVKRAQSAYQGRALQQAADARAIAIHKSACLQDAAIAFAKWKERGGRWPDEAI